MFIYVSFKVGLNMGLSGPVDHIFNLRHSHKCVNCICIVGDLKTRNRTSTSCQIEIHFLAKLANFSLSYKVLKCCVPMKIFQFWHVLRNWMISKHSIRPAVLRHFAISCIFTTISLFSIFRFSVCVKENVCHRKITSTPYCGRQSRFLYQHIFCFDCPFLKFYFHIHSWLMTLRPEEVESPTQLHVFQLSDSVCIVPFQRRIILTSEQHLFI